MESFVVDCYTSQAMQQAVRTHAGPEQPDELIRDEVEGHLQRMTPYPQTTPVGGHEPAQ